MFSLFCNHMLRYLFLFLTYCRHLDLCWIVQSSDSWSWIAGGSNHSSHYGKGGIEHIIFGSLLLLTLTMYNCWRIVGYDGCFHLCSCFTYMIWGPVILKGRWVRCSYFSRCVVCIVVSVTFLSSFICHTYDYTTK